MNKAYEKEKTKQTNEKQDGIGYSYGLHNFFWGIVGVFKTMSNI